MGQAPTRILIFGVFCRFSCTLKKKLGGGGGGSVIVGLANVFTFSPAADFEN